MLSKTAIQAVQALVVLSGLPDGEYAGASSIAKRTRAPQNYLGKLLRQLSGEGFVESQKGMGGGFRLARKPEEISMFEVVEAVENVSRWSGCILGQSICSDDNSCRLHNDWKNVRDHYLRFLRDTKISDIAARPGALSVIG